VVVRKLKLVQNVMVPENKLHVNYFFTVIINTLLKISMDYKKVFSLIVLILTSMICFADYSDYAKPNDSYGPWLEEQILWIPIIIIGIAFYIYEKIKYRNKK